MMLIRFCLYGFLKNQQYFVPFLFLAFIEKGLTFTQIGVLLAIEGITMQALEVPSGALADLFGRRRTMIISFLAYMVSFLALGLADSFWPLCGAMALFGIGESFRTGTHKTLIFAWLKLEGRSEEKTRVYGLTRSWSKVGSAVSAPIAMGIVITTSSYSSVFYWSILPCALSVVNLLGYPASIDPRSEVRATMRTVFAHLKESLLDVRRRPKLRRMVGESIGFHGLFRASKDYVQPALAIAAVAWFGGDTLGGETAELHAMRNTAFLVGAVYCVLNFGAAFASWKAHRFADFAGGDAAAARWLWGCLTVLFVGFAAASAGGVSAALIAGFAILFMLQNLWRPILMSRIYDEVEEKRGATVLSIESQGQRLAMVVLAPLFGYLVDWASGLGEHSFTESFWPVAVVAAALSAVFLARSRG